MIQFLYSLTLTFSMIFIYMNHPLSLGLILLAQTSVISLITGTLSMNFWFSYILFMIMIGGMLVLFIYMTSIASNEKFSFSPPITIIILFMLLTLFFMLFTDQMMNYQNLMNLDLPNLTSTSIYQISLSKYLNFPSNLIMMMLIIYLLLCLIAVVKITNISYGPLRHKS